MTDLKCQIHLDFDEKEHRVQYMNDSVKFESQ